MNTGIRTALVAATLVVTTALGGCGLSTLTSGLSGSMFGGGAPKPTPVSSVTEEQLLSAAKADFGTADVGAVAHGCPKFAVWPRENSLTIYEQGRIGDGLAVMHRGEITRTARECAVAPGRVSVKYGFSGRVLMGPRGATGRVQLPVTVFVTDDKHERLNSETVMVDVNLSPDNPIGYFSTVRSIEFQIPEGNRPGDYDVFVAFDRTAPGAG